MELLNFSVSPTTRPAYSDAMDKTDRDREVRIDESQDTLHHARMDEHTADALMERATDLAYEAFGQATGDDHVEWAFQRLVINWRWGLGAAGVVTVH